MSKLNLSIYDLTEQARTWGFEDACEGIDQRGSQFFANTTVWDAYNDGYLEAISLMHTVTQEADQYYYYAGNGHRCYVWKPETTE